MNNIIVVNLKRTFLREDEYEYVGRENRTYDLPGSPLANPYRVKPHGPFDRGTTIKLYSAWLVDRLEKNDPLVRNTLNYLYRKWKSRDTPLYLACWCCPKPCHAEIIRDALMNPKKYRDNTICGS